MKLKTVFSVYPDGEMDISVIGVRTIELKSSISPLSEKLYSAATVIAENTEIAEMRQLLSLRPLLMEYLQLKKGEPVKLSTERPVSSFDAAVLLNLAPDQKYSLLSLHSESERIKLIANELRILLQSRKMEIQLQQNFYLN